MFKSSRESKEWARKTMSELSVGDGDLTYSGVDCQFSVYSLYSGSKKVQVYLSYETDDVPWLKRSDFERGVVSYLKKQMTEYEVAEVRFVRK